MLLTLDRYVGQKILINNDISVQVIASNNGKVSLTFDAPENVLIDREEVRLKKELKAARAVIRTIHQHKAGDV